MNPPNQIQEQRSGSATHPLDYTYESTAGTDEVYTAQGEKKAHWHYLLDSLKTLGPEALENRQQKALRILRDDGATYNIYEDKTSTSRPWELDLVPALISSEDWRAIESGLLERAELLNLLLKDIYGPRDLIRTGVIPPEVVFAHKGFLRAVDGLALPGDQQLILHGVDLLRDEHGALRVLTDRTQSASGAGYALENRTVMSRVFPSLFRESQVHRLASFFQRLRSQLANLAINVDQPRIVLLTPGPEDETYFEHAYIANYLGFDLAQSRDLLVRDSCVWMKSLDGLRKVDVILRRVDDWFCDPVELRNDSKYGVAGLLEAVRSKNVVIINPLGTGVLENPVFLRYMPQIAKALLGRDLRLPSIETLWAGNDEDREQVLAHFDQLIIKPTFRNNQARAQIPAQLSAEERNTLRAKVLARPMDYVAQTLHTASRFPSFCHGSLQGRPALLRTYAIACRGSYSLMPGGLTRVSRDPQASVAFSQASAFSKDTWVIASEPEAASARVEFDDNVAAPQTSAVSLPSRVVENMFWMGRYAERAEATLRMMRTVFVMLNGEENISFDCRKLLLRTVTEVSASHPGFIDADEDSLNSPDGELLLLLRDSKRAGSVRSNLNAMLICAEESKELLSSDTLRVINDIRDAIEELDTSLAQGLASAPEEALDPLVTGLMALSGLAHESMVRNFGWRFLDIGRRLERGMLTATMITSMLSEEMDNAIDQQVLIEAMLLTLDSLISYRRRYRARLGVQSSLDLVLLDTSNPRALLYQIEQIAEHIEALPNTNETRNELSQEARAVLEAQTKIKLSSLTQLSQRENGMRAELHQLISRVQHLLSEMSISISDKYFDHRETSHQLVDNPWSDD